MSFSPLSPLFSCQEKETNCTEIRQQSDHVPPPEISLQHYKLPPTTPISAIIIWLSWGIMGEPPHSLTIPILFLDKQN